MALITLREYMEKHGKTNQRLLRAKAARGGFKTAVKMGRDWLIDEDEPLNDLRTREARKTRRDSAE